MAWDTHPQLAGGWLYFLKPDVVMRARVNMASVTYPAYEITYDTVTVGGYTDINIGQTILIGSTPGGYDLGRTYLRASPTSSVLPIGRSSRGVNAGEVNLTDNAYITVLDTYEVWAKRQWVNDDNDEWYKDQDLNGTTPPTPLMHIGDLGGLGHIGFADSGVLSIDFDWSGSTLIAPGETWVDRNWYFVDGTPTSGSTTTADPTVEFPVGKRWVRLYGEGSEGGLTYRRYLVVVLDPDDPDTVRFTNLTYRREAQGVVLRADVQERLDPSEYPPGTIVMYLAREVRGSEVTIVQRFAGWLDTDANVVQANELHTRVTTSIRAVDVAGELAQLKSMASAVENEAAQTNWLHMVGANPERYIHRLLAFETTALTLCDLTLTGLTGSAAYPVMSFSTTGGKQYSTCDGLARAFGRRLTCDSQGRLLLAADPMRQNSGDRTTTVQRDITENDYSSIKYNRRKRPAVGVLKSQNVVVSSGYSSTVITPFPDVYSVAPGEAAGQGPGDSSVARGVVQHQTESNERVGHDYARLTTADSLYTVELAHGVDAGIEPAAMTWVRLSATSGNRGYLGPSLSSERGLPVAVEIRIDGETGVSTQSLIWERETVGTPGVIDRRKAATQAPVTPASPPVGTTLTRSVSGLGLITNLALFCTNNKVHLVSRLLDLLTNGTPTVTSHSLTLTGTLAAFAVRADSLKYVTGTGAVDGYLATDEEVLTISDIAGTRLLGTPYSYADGAVVAESQVQVQVERGNPDWVLVAAYYDTLGTRVFRSTTGGSSWADESTLPFAYDSNLPNNAGTWKPGLWMHPNGGGAAIVSAALAIGNPPGADFWGTDDYGATWTKIVTSGYVAGDWTCGSIVKPFSRADVVFHGYVDYVAPNIVLKLMRIIGTTQTNISASHGGSSYGTGGYPQGLVAQRAISVADDDPNAGVYVGYNIANAKIGVFQSFNVLAATPTWNVLVEPDTSVAYRGAYYVNADLIFLFGNAGAFAIARYEAGGWTLYEMTVSGAGAIVGMCGL